MTQPTLFDLGSETGFYGQKIDSKQIARSTDPETSKQAAANVDLEGNCKLFYDTLAASDSPLTSQEIAANAVLIDGSIPVASALSKRESIRKRASEMVEVKKVVRSVGSRICTVTGKESKIYEVVR